MPLKDEYIQFLPNKRFRGLSKILTPERGKLYNPFQENLFWDGHRLIATNGTMIVVIEGDNFTEPSPALRVDLTENFPEDIAFWLPANLIAETLEKKIVFRVFSDGTIYVPQKDAWGWEKWGETASLPPELSKPIAKFLQVGMNFKDREPQNMEEILPKVNLNFEDIAKFVAVASMPSDKNYPNLSIKVVWSEGIAVLELPFSKKTGVWAIEGLYR